MIQNPCVACANRDRLRRELRDRVRIHMRTVESLFRDIQSATPDDLPRLEQEVDQLPFAGDRRGVTG